MLCRITPPSVAYFHLTAQSVVFYSSYIKSHRTVMSSIHSHFYFNNGSHLLTKKKSKVCVLPSVTPSGHFYSDDSSSFNQQYWLHGRSPSAAPLHEPHHAHDPSVHRDPACTLSQTQHVDLLLRPGLVLLTAGFPG